MNKHIKGVIWHHSGGVDANPLASTKHHTAEIIDNSHRNRWPGFTSNVYANRLGQFFHVGYNTVIEATTKKRVKTREYGEETAAAIGYNTGWIHVVVTGNYDKGADVWDQEVDRLVIDEWNAIKTAYPYLKISDNVPHRKYARKSCFGNSLPDNHIQLILATQVSDPIELTAELEVKMMKTIIDLSFKVVSILQELVLRKRYSVHQK